MLTDIGLVEHARSKLGHAYMFGYTGIVSETAIQQKKRQYPRMYTTTYINKCRKNIGRWATDCSGLVDIYVGKDLSASMYYNQASKKGPISTIPKNTPGILVFKKSSNGTIDHVGVCVGDGTVIEAKGVDYGIVQTKLTNNGWSLWAYCHLIQYSTPKEDTQVIQKGSKGEIVRAWQKGLIKIGISIGAAGADGDFGSNTKIGTETFQKKYGLPITGSVNEANWATLTVILLSKF